MTSPVLDDYAFQYGNSQVIINGLPSPDGSIIDITDVEGLDSAPNKTSTASYEGRDGGILNAFHEDMRIIKLTGTLYGSPTTSIFQTLDVLKMLFATGQDPQPLYFQQEGTNLRQVFAKALGVNYSWTAAMRTGQTPIVINLQAEDPTIYGVTEYTPQGFAQTPNSVPGYAWSRAWSYSWGGGSPVGLTFLTNNGTKYTGFKATLMGQACTNPQIISDTESSVVDTNITVGSNDTLVFDFYNQVLLLNDQARGGAVVNEGWFKLQPGINAIRFLCDSNTPASITYDFFDGYR